VPRRSISRHTACFGRRQQQPRTAAECQREAFKRPAGLRFGDQACELSKSSVGFHDLTDVEGADLLLKAP
jgi:hypothetical protein